MEWVFHRLPNLRSGAIHHQRGAGEVVLVDDFHICYTVSKCSPVVLEWKEPGSVSKRSITWSVVYTMEGFRDWLLSCKKAR